MNGSPGRSAALLVVLASVIACDGEAEAEVTVEQARTSFCGHAPEIASAMVGSVVQQAPPHALLMADAALYERAGERTTADALRNLANSIGPAPPMIRAFVEDELTGPQLDELEASLASLADAETVTFMTKAEAYRTFRRVFAHEPSVVANTSPGAIPASYDVTFEGDTDLGPLMNQVEALDGVRSAVRAGPYPDTPVLEEARRLLDHECPGALESGLFPRD
jgi:hypothetical protein